MPCTVNREPFLTMQNRFYTPDWVKRHYLGFGNFESVSSEKIERIRRGIAKFNVANPVASIIIPAYNEEENLLGTISSFRN